jgi:hypothetical protein
MSDKAYLGDGVYVEHDNFDFGVILTTEDGYKVTNRIYLEPSVFRALEGYVNPPGKGGEESDSTQT